MKRDECKRATPTLVDIWRKERGLENTPPNGLSFYGFRAWLSEHHPEYLKFRTSISVEYDLEMWFDSAVRQLRHVIERATRI